MSTRFKLIFESKEPDIDVPIFQRSLPSDFEVTDEAEGIYITIASQNPEDERCQYLVDRELDRHFFLTSVKIRAEMMRRTLTGNRVIRNRIHGCLPKVIGPQCWNYELPIQLRLWSMADDADDPALKVILLFQIIELSYPEKSHYPRYTAPNTAPHVLTECKFVRHLVAHSGDVGDEQLKWYCEYLNIPEMMLDPTDSTYATIINQKLKLLEMQARNAIADSL